MPATSPIVDEMEQHRPALTRYIHYLVRDAAEAEDLAQETFVRAHRQRSTLRDQTALAGWLYQIAIRVSIDRLRLRARTTQRQVDYSRCVSLHLREHERRLPSISREVVKFLFSGRISDHAPE